MLLSFSVDYMRPYVEAGIRQAQGVNVGDQRVKRQTIRSLGTNTRRLLNIPHPHTRMYLHLWWKSRTKDRAFLGVVGGWTIRPITIQNDDGFLLISIDDRKLSTGTEQENFALADGFAGRIPFLEYFAPIPGTVFRGVVYKW